MMKKKTREWIRIIGAILGICIALIVFVSESFDYRDKVISNMEQFCKEKGLTYDNRSIEDYCIVGFDRHTGLTHKYYLTFDEWENIKDNAAKE